MDLRTATIILLALYAAVTLVIVYIGAKKVKTMKDYTLGSVKFSPWSVGLSLAAAMTSAATFVINPGLIATFGFSGVISYALALPFAAMVSLAILSARFRTQGNAVKASTMAQWMGKRYNSPGFSLFFAFLGLLLLTFITLILVGLTKVISKPLGADETVTLIVIAVFVFGYMSVGGANSMVYTNTVQAIIMIIVAVILLSSGLNYFENGLSGFAAGLAKIDPNLTSMYNPNSFLFRDFYEIVIAQLIIGFAIVCQPHILGKSLLLSSDKDMKRYLFFAITVQTLFFFVVFAGLYARLQFPDLMYNGKKLTVDGIIPAFVVTRFSIAVVLLVTLGLISAGISTIEGLIQSMSASITQDIYKPLFLKNTTEETSERTQFVVNKIVIVLIAVVSVVMALDQLKNPKLSVAVFAQNGVYAYFSAAFIPLLFGMFVKEAKASAVIPASVVAIIVHFIFYYGAVKVPFSIATGENPAVASSVAIICALLVGGVLQFGKSEKK